jgi:hypothetical protein
MVIAYCHRLKGLLICDIVMKSIKTNDASTPFRQLTDLRFSENGKKIDLDLIVCC